MWKRLFENSRIMSVRMLGSYLAIIAAPLAAIIIFYIHTNDALLTVQYEKSYSLLTESVTSFERQLSEVQNVSRHLMDDPDVIRFAKGYKDKQNEFWGKYRFAQTQPDYSMTNQIVDAVYVLIRDSAYIIKLPAVVPASTLGFSSVNEFAIDSYEELLEQFCRNWSYGKVYWLEDENGKEHMAVVHSVNEKRPVQGAIVVTLKRSTADSVLGGCNPYEASSTMILSGDGDILKQVSGREAEIQAEKLLEQIYQPESRTYIFEKKSGYQRMKLDGEVYLVSWKYSAQQDWIYTTVTPEDVLTQQIRGMRVWMVVMMLIALMISLLLCTYHWAKRRVIIRQYYDLRGAEAKVGIKQSFLSAVRDLLDQVENLRTTLLLQENIVKTSVLRKLLYGEYSDREEMIAELEHAELSFPRGKYFVAVWSFDHIPESGSFRDMVEFRAYIRSYLEQKTGFFYHFYEVNYNTLAIIFSDEALDSLIDIKNWFLECNSELRELVFIEGYTGVADPVTELAKLAACFDEAKEACEYARYYHLATPISGEEMPQLTVNPFFSVEMEKRFETAIKEDSNEMLRNLFNEILVMMETQKPGTQMVNHYRNFVRSAAMKTLSEYCVEQEMLTKVSEISEADSWSRLFNLILEAKRMIRAMTKQQAEKETEPVKKEIMDILYEKYADQDFSLAELAKRYCISESKMYKDFRLYFGKSFAEMLETVRMEKACELLKTGVSVKDVTAMAGYSSDTSFRRAFKRVTGMTPTEYCQNNGK